MRPRFVERIIQQHALGLPTDNVTAWTRFAGRIKLDQADVFRFAHRRPEREPIASFPSTPELSVPRLFRWSRTSIQAARAQPVPRAAHAVPRYSDALPSALKSRLRGPSFSRAYSISLGADAFEPVTHRTRQRAGSARQSAIPAQQKVVSIRVPFHH
jgi:hypothetical protein